MLEVGRIRWARRKAWGNFILSTMHRTHDARKRILVTGGLGFIGHRVVGMLVDLGATVEIIDSCTDYGVYEPTRHAANLAARIARVSNVRVHRFDVIDYNATLACFESFRPQTVIHLASVPIARVALERPLHVGTQLVEGTLTLLEASRHLGVNRFVYASSSMTYGDFETETVTETHRQHPLEIYGSLKLACEFIVRNYSTIHHVPHTIVRPTAVYGPTGNEAFVLTRFVRAAKERGRIKINGADTKLDFTFVDDTAMGIVLAATVDAAINETFNIACGCARLLIEAAKHLQRIAPGFDIEMAERDPLYPRRGTLGIDKARTLLGYEPSYTLERGLEEFYASI